MVQNKFGELRRVGSFGQETEAGACVDGLRRDLAGLAVGAAALDLHGLDSTREEQTGTDGADLPSADLVAAVPGPGGAGLHREQAPGQVSQRLAQLLLVPLDDQEVVAADGDDVLGVGALGVHRTVTTKSLTSI
ncbi:hypothetical protein AB0G76_36515 [Streptomyces asoensis]|uniref:hypothetical protein n=1 Tax=Streptomyces asoensis TaxID=249586 RepID=UPI0033D73F14